MLNKQLFLKVFLFWLHLCLQLKLPLKRNVLLPKKRDLPLHKEEVSMLKNIVCFIGLSFSLAASASLISYNGYTLDTDTNIVTGGGVQWLQWDVTTNQSINTALAANGVFDGTNYGSGWELASNLQLASLFDAFSLFSTTNPNYTAHSSQSYNGSDTDDTAYAHLRQLFGDTDYHSGEPYGEVFDAYAAALALYGSNADGSGLYNLVSVIDDYTFHYTAPAPGYTAHYGDNAYLYQAQYSADYRSALTGIALVRAPKVTDAAVPEPPTLLVFSFGLLALALPRKKTSAFARRFIANLPRHG